MHNIWTIANREYKLYFSSPVAYVVAAAIYLLVGILFYLNLQFATIQTGFVPGVDAILGPLATLLLFLVQRSPPSPGRGTAAAIELLLTAPIKGGSW
jgi:ABC-2 type transport system permease protein